MESLKLDQKETVKLFLQGRDVWNNWVECNPNGSLTFRDVNFDGILSSEEVIDFSGFNFPKIDFVRISCNSHKFNFSGVKFLKGGANFSGAKFGKTVIFENVDFGENVTAFQGTAFNSTVSFSGAVFGNVVIFQRAKFSNGNFVFGAKGRLDKDNIIIRFENAVFSNCNIRFSNNTLEAKKINFERAKFINSQCSFIGAKIKVGDFTFNEAIFENSPINFDNSDFCNVNFNFNNVLLKKSNVSFMSASFNNSIITFNHIVSDTSDFRFNEVSLGNSEFKFESSVFDGNCIFSELKKTDETIIFSFKNSSFKGSLDLSKNKFNIVIDLTGTHISNQVVLDSLECSDIKNKKLLLFSKNADENDVCKYRRLKELAEQNRDHHNALKFHASEMQAKRWQKNTNLYSTCLDYLYDFLSNYGRSEIRPLIILIVTWLSFSFVYFDKSKINDDYTFTTYAITYSATNTFPGIINTTYIKKEIIENLYSGVLPVDIFLFSIIQNLISVILLFLIGLALRNRFRI